MMSRPDDAKLLWCALALQRNFLTGPALLAALRAWPASPERDFGQFLLQQRALLTDQYTELANLVEQHLRAKDGTPAATLNTEASGSPCDAAGASTLQATLDLLAPTQDEAAPGFPTDITQGGHVSRYHILRPHARGGLGEVFVAHDEELHREVALKEIQLKHAHHSESRTRFLLEAELTGQLEHPCIVPVYGLGVYPDGRPYYAIRLIQGESLKEAIDHFHKAETKDSALELRQLLRRFLDVCNAVAYAHSRGVIHRDLKPDNIMLGKFGETLVVDWGLAKPLGTAGEQGPLHLSSAADGTGTAIGSIMGTPTYMSPEQASGALDRLTPASDIFSLGAILATILTGNPPYQGPNILDKAERGEWRAPRQVNPRTPVALDAVCRKAMAFRPDDRYASAQELAADVEHWLADEPVTAYRESWPARAFRWARRHRTLVTGTTAALVVAGLGLWALLALQAAADRREVAARQKEIEAWVSQAEGNERLALVKHERGENEAALALLQQARDILSRLEVHDRPQQSRGARVSYNLATMLRATEKLDQAEEQYRQTIADYEALVAEDAADPEALSDLAQAHSGLGHLLQTTERAEAALAAYNQAFPHQEQAIVLAPDNLRYRLMLAAIYNDRALAHERRASLPDMEKNLKDALRVLEEARKPLAEKKDASLDRTLRRQLAVTHQNLGNLLARQNQHRKAIGEFAQSVALATALRREIPGTLDYDLIAAKSGMNQGFAYLRLSEQERAERPLQAAADLVRELRERLPKDADVQMTYAGCLLNLGVVTALRIFAGKVPEAERSKVLHQVTEQVYEADRILQVLGRNGKDADQVALFRGTTYHSLATLNYQDQKWTAALDWSDRALALFQSLVKPGRTDFVLNYKIIAARSNRALALFRLGRYPEALEEVDGLLRSGADPVVYGLFRAGILAKSGSHEKGVAYVEALLAGLPGTPSSVVLYEAAGDFSLALDGLTVDKSLSEKLKEEKAHAYASRSVDLLRKAVKAGYSDLTKIRDSGKAGDPDLAPLRRREEFQKFLRELPPATDAGH
jgi:serine/threonine-protein kinase